jgi:SAM-dependent methyltransferase
MGWVESPSYVLRRWTVLRELADVPRGRLLEIGCGAGDLLVHLAAAGFEPECVETSEAARREAAERLRRHGLNAVPAVGLDEVPGRFDVVVACEVLEHIADDEAALRAWTGRLVPGGRLLVTVPAHARRFGASDTWAGHFRRYDRDDLERLAAAADLEVERLLCYAFPLGNLVEPVRNRVNRRRLERDTVRTAAERTARSGTERSVEHRLRWLSHPALLSPFCWLQVPFFHAGLGTGYLLLGRRRDARR